MHEYLAAGGVDGVKVDCQAGVGLLGSAPGSGGATIAQAYHAALERSIAANFPGNHAINCMCHSTENLYRCGRSRWQHVCRHAGRERARYGQRFMQF